MGATGAVESVVVPAAGVPSTVTCLRSLGQDGVRTVVVSEDDTATAFYSAHCDEAVVVPDPRESLLAYRDALLDVTSREAVRTIVPVREEDVYVLARYREAFEEHVSLPIPPLSTLERAHDRVALVEAAEAAGVPAPETRPLGDVEDWSRELLVKSRYNLLTDAYLDSLPPDEALSADRIDHVASGERPDREALRSAFGHEPIVQEYVPSDEEYVVGALYDRGDPLATFQHHQVRGTNYTGSGGAYRESIAISELEEVSRALLDQLDWHGLACLEYMRDAETGEFVLAEINPRTWQSVAAAVAAGADFPMDYWLQATGRRDEIEPGYDVGVGCHWLKGELMHVLSLYREDSPFVDPPGYLSTVGDVLASCVEHPQFDLLSLDDPGPFVQDWWRHLAGHSAVPELRIPGADGIAERRTRNPT